MTRDLNVGKMPVRKYRRDTSEVSCCLKYVIFGFNVMFWVSTLWERNIVIDYVVELLATCVVSYVPEFHQNCTKNGAYF